MTDVVIGNLTFTENFINWCDRKFPMYRDVVKGIVEELEIYKPIKFNVSDVQSAISDNDGPESSIEFNETNKISSLFEFCFIAAHELFHTYQSVNGRLVQQTTSIGRIGQVKIWNGELIWVPCWNNDEYYTLPWELEANQFARQYSERRYKKVITDRFYGKIIQQIYKVLDKGEFDNRIQPFNVFKRMNKYGFRESLFDEILDIFRKQGYNV